MDIAKLVFEIDSTQAQQAEKRLDSLAKASERVETSARKVRTATEQAGIGVSGASTASERATRTATAHAQAIANAEKVMRGSLVTQSESIALLLRNATVRDNLAKQEARAAAESARSAKTTAAETAQAERERIAAWRESQRTQAEIMRERVALARAAEREEAASAREAARSASAAERERAQAWRQSQRLQAEIMRERVQLARAAEREEAQAAKDAARAAKEAASEAAQADKEAARATAAAEKERVSAWRQSQRIQAEIMRERVSLARQAEKEEAQAAKEAADANRDLERRIHALKSAIDPTYAAQSRLDAEMKEAAALYRMGAISSSDYSKRVSQLDTEMAAAARGQMTLNGVVINGAGHAKALQNATLNLGRQFADIGVQLSSGQSPFLVLIQQGPQIADAFAMAKQQGLGFSAVLKGIYASLAPFLPLLAGVGAVAGVVFGGAALAARALNKDNKDLAASLGLTEKQMERLKDKGVNTGVTIGDVFKGTFNYIKGAIAPTLAPVIKWFNDLFDGITKGAVITVKAIVGGFAGAFAGIKTIWADLPAVMGDLFASGANLAISAIEKLLNFATAGINKLIEKANMVSGKVGGPQIGALGGFSLSRVDNPNAGAASRTAANAAAAVADAYTKAGQGVDKVFAGIGAEILKSAKDRIKKAAGDPEKARKTAEIRDMSEERSAQIAAQLEQAMADELRARLSMAKEISERANIEREIARATASAKQSRIDAQIASIADDKGLSDLKKGELTLELKRLKFIEGGIADIQRQAISEKERADLAAEALANAQAISQNEIDLLQSRQALTQSAYESAKIEREIVEKRYQMERATLQATADNTTLKESERRIAQQRLETLQQIHANELKQLDKSASIVDAMSNAVSAINDMARAFKSGDIGGGISGLSNALKQVSGLLGSASGLGGSLGGIANFLGPIGGLVSSITSLFGGLFGGSSKKKAAKRAAEEQAAAEAAAKALEIANQKRSLEIQLMEAQGWSFAALTASRADELAKMDESNRALAQQVYDAQDAAKTKELELQLLEATGQAEAALSYRRHMELSALSETDQAIQKQIWAANDNAKAQEALATAQEAAASAAASLLASQKQDVDALVSAAQSALKEAYDAQAAEITATRDKMQAFADSFKEFRLGLIASTDAVGDFYNVARAARLGDTTAMGNLISSAQAADAQAANNARTQQDYVREQAKIRAAVQAAEDTANRQVTVADQQLAALQEQVKGYITLNTSVLSVADAVKALQGALGLQSTIYGAVSNPNRNWGVNKDANMALVRATGYAGDFGTGGFQSWIEQQPESIKALARQSLVDAGQAYRIAFATGGSFTAGGDGRTDSTPVDLSLTRGEVVNVSREDTMADLVEAVRELVSDFRSVSNQTVPAMKKVAKIVDRWDGNGIGVRNQANPDDPIQVAVA